MDKLSKFCLERHALKKIFLKYIYICRTFSRSFFYYFFIKIATTTDVTGGIVNGIQTLIQTYMPNPDDLQDLDKIKQVFIKEKVPDIFANEDDFPGRKLGIVCASRNYFRNRNLKIISHMFNFEPQVKQHISNFHYLFANSLFRHERRMTSELMCCQAHCTSFEDPIIAYTEEAGYHGLLYVYADKSQNNGKTTSSKTIKNIMMSESAFSDSGYDCNFGKLRYVNLKNKNIYY